LHISIFLVLLHYIGLSYAINDDDDDHHLFETELVNKIIYEMKKGKAPDIGGLSVEHLLYSHSSLPFILSKFFKLIFFCRYVLLRFKKSYIVPIPKPKDCRSKAMTR